MACCCYFGDVLFVSLIALAAYLFKRFYWEKKTIEHADKLAVLITGCDTGFGRELTMRCLLRGMTVVATCLTKKAVESLRFETRWLPGHLEGIVMDVTSDASVADAKDKVTKFLENKGKGLYGIVNNAGAIGNSFEDDFLTVDDYKAVAEVNTFGAIRVVHAFKRLIKQSRGRIVITTSTAGRSAPPGVGPYSASKFALEGYCDTIRQELKPFGVKVSIVEPGFFRTSICDVAATNRKFDAIWERCSEETKEEYGHDFLEKRKALCAAVVPYACPNTEMVTDAYLHALTAVHPRSRYVVGFDAVFIYAPISLLPACVHDFLISALTSLTGISLVPAAATEFDY